MKIIHLLASLLIAAVAAHADTEVPAQTAQSIKTYSMKKYMTELPFLKNGDIIRLEFSYRERGSYGDGSGDSFETTIYGGSRGDRAQVQVPNSGREWFLKIPDHGGVRNARSHFVFASVHKEEKGGNVSITLIGTSMQYNFGKAVIRWTGGN